MGKSGGFPSVVPLPLLLPQTCLQQVVATWVFASTSSMVDDGVGLGENWQLFLGLRNWVGWVGGVFSSQLINQVNTYLLSEGLLGAGPSLQLWG